jgi:pentose-5-phosphate-3-epimerase
MLACDFLHAGEELRKIDNAGAQWVHIDVAPRENFANILNAIDHFVYLENRKKTEE